MNTSTRLITFLEVAIFAAIAVVFNEFISPFQIWPNGGSITLVMIPIALIAFRRGLVAGILTGLIMGLVLTIMPSAFRVNPIQVLLDYPLAFASLGVAGWVHLTKYSNPSQRALWAGIGLLTAGILRFVMHYLSGVIFFAEFAPEGQSVYLYSLFYNATYILPEIILATIVLAILLYSAPQLIQPNYQRR
ncbi:energy-coupled thiamine transporter ThiT [Risungbinella massiliensis]|uniref:energy-coupled thiamine transporter ThiT n=1 Tax=Risungbinella massiliensis TaxID=1329796 RepID=UPI0005CBD03C|nr:energy-coupled thiamine transporter ThiT [Risungbinella massiliensis]